MVAANVRFDVKQIIVSACRRQQTPVQAMNAIANTLDAHYTRILVALALVEPSYTRGIAAREDKELAENLILVGSHKRIPFILTHDLVPYLEYGKVRVKASRSMRNKRLKADVIQYGFGGVFADVRALVNDQNKDLPASKLADVAHFLVDYQISKRPEVSEYPIEVIEITAKNEVRWLYCTPLCGEKQLVRAARDSPTNEICLLEFCDVSLDLSGRGDATGVLKLLILAKRMSNRPFRWSMPDSDD